MTAVKSKAQSKSASSRRVPTISHITRLVLFEASNPDQLKGRKLFERVKHTYQNLGGDPKKVKVGTVNKARTHAIEHCGRPLTNAKVADLMHALVENPRNVKAARLGSKTKVAQPSHTNNLPQTRNTTPRVTLPPMDVVEKVVSYTTEQILGAKLFIRMFSGVEAATEFLRLIGKE